MSYYRKVTQQDIDNDNLQWSDTLSSGIREAIMNDEFRPRVVKNIKEEIGCSWDEARQLREEYIRFLDVQANWTTAEIYTDY